MANTVGRDTLITLGELQNERQVVLTPRRCFSCVRVTCVCRSLVKNTFKHHQKDICELRGPTAWQEAAWTKQKRSCVTVNDTGSDPSAHLPGMLPTV